MFGPRPTARFDPHAPPPHVQRVGVMYLSYRAAVPGLTTAIAESFQSTRVVDRQAEDPWVVWWTPIRPLQLLDLASTWTTRAGGNQAMCSGDRRRAREWARAIHAQLDVDGITWTSSVLGAGRSVALWNRATDALPPLSDVNRPLADPALFPDVSQIADQLGYGLI